MVNSGANRVAQFRALNVNMFAQLEPEKRDTSPFSVIVYL
jgi:hypothetical protein